jgi:hypothetical protein
MKELTKENIQAYAIKFSKMFDVDFEEKLKQEKSKATSIGEFCFSRDVFGVYRYAEEEMLIEALVTFNDLIKDSVKNIRISDYPDLRELSAKLLEFAEMIDFCEYHSEIIMDEYVKTYDGYWLFEGHDIKKELGDLWMFPRMEKALGMKLFENYSYYIANSSVPPKDSEFKINPNFYIVDSINSFLRFAKKENTDEVRATYLLKIEDILEYSYFVLVIQYKGNVWIGTDKMMFANPNNKYHRRNPYRSREDHFEYLDLPYGILDRLEEIRKETKVPVPNSNMELHVLKMKDFHIETKAFMHQLAAHLVGSLEHAKLKQIASYEDVMLALPSGVDVRNDQGFSSDRFKGVDERAKEIQDLFSETSTELAVINKDLVTTSKHYDPEWLATPESLQNLNNWIANDKLKVEYEEKLEKLYPSSNAWSIGSNRGIDIRDNLHKEFGRAIKNKVDNVFQYAFVADEVYVKLCTDISQFGSRGEEKGSIVWFNHQVGYYSAITVRDETGKWTSNGFKGECSICNNHKESKHIDLTFHSAKELQTFFGLNHIPDWFKLYRYHGLTPYHGNSILDNVDPLAMIEDNVSERYKNGFTVTIQMCGWCYNKLVKQHRKWEKALILYDVPTNKIISINEYDGKNMIYSSIV